MTQVNVNDLTELITEQSIELHMLKKAYNQLMTKYKEVDEELSELKKCEE